MPTPQDFAWAAGLFEGEGNLNRKPLSMSLGSTDEDVIRRFHSIIISGEVYGPYKTNGKGGCGNYQLYTWKCTNRDRILTICYSLFNFLCQRRRSRIHEIFPENFPFTETPSRLLNNGDRTIF